MRAKNLLSILSLSIFTSIGAFCALENKTSVKEAKAELIDTFISFVDDRDDIKMNYNLETGEYVATEVYFDNEEYFLIKQGENTYGADSILEWTYFGDGENNTIRMLDSGTYYIYFTSDLEIYAEPDPHLEADNWAIDFVQNVGCDNPDEEYGPINWDWYSSSFYNLSDGAKDIFVEAAASNEQGATFIEQAAFIHDLCVVKYGLTVFMYRDGGGSRSPSYSISNSKVESDSTSIVVIIAATLSITTLFGLVIFKKSKLRK